MLKTSVVEKVANPLYHNTLRCYLNGEKFGKLLHGIGLRMWENISIIAESCALFDTFTARYFEHPPIPFEGWKTTAVTLSLQRQFSGDDGACFAADPYLGYLL